MYLFYTLIFASIGGYIATKLKIPAGALIGALFAVSVYNIITSQAFMPIEIKIFTQIISGIFIGTSISKKDIEVLKRSLRPAILTIVLLFIACITMGIIMHYYTKYSLTTTLFATAPGSLLNMTLMSEEMNANTPVVSILQITRLITVISLFPPLLNMIILKILHRNKTNYQVNHHQEKVNLNKDKHKWTHITVTMLIGTAAGLLGYLSPIPAGSLMFSMIGSAVLHIFWDKAYIPMHSKKIAQVFGGALIGTNVLLESIIEMKSLIIPAILLMFGYFVINLILAYILYRRCQLDMTTALLSCTPGGASTISLMADDFGAKTSIVSTLQILRSISVVTFYPFIIQFFYSLLK